MRYWAIFRLLSVGPRRSPERTEFRLHRLLTDDYDHDSQHGNIAGELRTETRRPDLTRALPLETITTVAIYPFAYPCAHEAKDCADAHFVVDLIPDS